MHAFIWRNWPLVPVERIASVIGASRQNVERTARAMGLDTLPRMTREQQRRSYITIIKRNWHLLPYDQLLALLDWPAEKLAFTLREDDFLFIKLGSHKPTCEPLKWTSPDAETRAREHHIAEIVRETLPKGVHSKEPLFAFVDELSSRHRSRKISETQRPLRLCYSYFALYGDPLLEPDLDPYPDGYLARLAECGVNAVWLQGLLSKLAPFPWQPELSTRHEERLKNLRQLAIRAHKHGIAVYLYLNEPRAMPLKFFETHPELKGAVEGDHAALCTSNYEVDRWLREAVELICSWVPQLGGFFTITASENLSNCWSHGNGASCPRCAKKQPAEVIADVNAFIAEGIQRAYNDRVRYQEWRGWKPDVNHPPQLIAWDWGWKDTWVEEIIRQLPDQCALMSVSEWSLPIERGGVKSSVGEYSISSIGPGPRAKRHWELARKRGLKVIAKIQANNSWELSAVPYIPALENVAQHAVNLRAAGIEDVMLGWTLGGYPSPNLETVSLLLERNSTKTPADALREIATSRFGNYSDVVLNAWHQFSAAFSEFPFHIGVAYSGPQQVGPANLLFEQRSGYRATMVGFPYDDLSGWRSIYPADTFIAQLDKVANGFATGTRTLRDALPKKLSSEHDRVLARELGIAQAAGLHFRSVANQARFILAREALAKAAGSDAAETQILALEKILRDELTAAQQLHSLQAADSTIGFEASNQYYYVPVDLAEKVLNCRDLLERWLPAQRQRWRNDVK
jgi:hypothetical protein